MDTFKHQILDTKINLVVVRCSQIGLKCVNIVPRIVM